MELRIAEVNRTCVIGLSGRLDMQSSPDLRSVALTRYTRGQCKKLTIDFDRVSYIDTSGLATLLEILVAAREQKAQLTLSGVNEKVQYLLDVNGLTSFFRIETPARERSPA
jgi:anti-sigma B factor antagonist